VGNSYAHLILQRATIAHQKANPPETVGCKHSISGAPACTFLFFALAWNQAVEKNVQNASGDQQN